MAWDEVKVKSVKEQLVMEMEQFVTDIMSLLGVDVVPAVSVTFVRVEVALSERERREPPLEAKVSVVNVTIARLVDATKSCFVFERESVHGVSVTMVPTIVSPMMVRVDVTE